MKRALAVLTVATVAATVLVTGCSSSASTWATGCADTPKAGGGAAGVQQARDALLKTGLRPVLGIEIVDLDSCTETVDWKARQTFPTASVVKLLIALDLIGRSGVPTGANADTVRRMLSASDDAAASQLWEHDGGVAIVQRQVRQLGLADTAPPANPGEWGDTTMSPADAATVYRYVSATLSPDARDFLTQALSSAPRNASDGFDQYFGIPQGLSGTTWAVKQGWGSSEGRRVLNTTGLVRDGGDTYAVVLMSSWPAGVDWPTATSALTAATSALRDALRPTGSVGDA